MNYAEWNDAIAQRFFNPNNNGKRGYLAVDRELLAELGGSPDAAAQFVSTVKSTPDGVPKSSATICRLAKRCRENWREAGAHGRPPYLAYLSLFVLAASTEGEYQNEGFQKRLHRLLGEEVSSVPPHGFYDLWELWEDLELWANEDLLGALGTFSCPLAGAKPYVDQPCSQIVLTEGERKRLSEIFAAGDLDPSAPPASEALAAIAVRYGSGRLLAKTVRRLSRVGSVDEDFRASTLEAILEELRNWNGIAEYSSGRNEFHTLRINLTVTDKLSGLARSRLIVKDSESFDEAPMILQGPPSLTPIRLGQFEGGWSAGLEDCDGRTMDASCFPWEEGLRLTRSAFVFRFPGRRVRVFKHGEFDGVAGLLEANRLDPHREFYVATDASSKTAVEKWGKLAVEGWREMVLRSGLPKGWTLFFGKRANTTVAAPSEFSVLRTDPQVRILLTEGVKVRPMGRRYFDFAPPTVRLEGLSPTMRLLVNGEARDAEAGDVLLRFNSSEPPPQVVVEVTENGEARCSASFQTVSCRDLAWRGVSPPVGSSSLGQLIQAGNAACALGGKVSGFFAPRFVYCFDRPAFLIGAQPGQIVSIPAESPPKDWQPVWLVEQGRGKRRAVFCGGDPAACMPMSEGIADRKKVREWKRILWYDRRNLTGPTRGQSAGLWARYREVAERV